MYGGHLVGSEFVRHEVFIINVRVADDDDDDSKKKKKKDKKKKKKGEKDDKEEKEGGKKKSKMVNRSINCSTTPLHISIYL